MADSIARQSEPDFLALTSEVRRRGRASSAYALLFAYVLDGLVWRELEKRGRLPKQEIDVEHPYWSGTFWAVFPRQDESPGTNDTSVGNANLRMMWTSAVLSQYPTLANAEKTKAFLEAVGKAPPGAAPPAAPTGSPLARALVVDERRDDPLYLHGKQIAHSVAEAIVTSRLDDVIHNASDSQRVLIATHELIWMVLGRAAKNPAFRSPAVARMGATSLSDLAPLLVVAIRADRP